MPSDDINAYLRTQLDDLKAKGLYKAERRITSPQRSGITVNGQEVINFCANNYLGLANHPDIVNAALEGLKAWGYGLSSVRFICGTQDIHKRCEQQIAKFFGKGDSILYISFIDGVRLCKAQRFRYKHNDMSDLKAQLEAAKGCRFKMIFTDSVFSMDGDLAKLPEICELAD